MVDEQLTVGCLGRVCLDVIGLEPHVDQVSVPVGGEECDEDGVPLRIDGKLVFPLP